MKTKPSRITRTITSITFACLIEAFFATPTQAAFNFDNNVVQTFDFGAGRLLSDPVRGFIYASITDSNSVAVIDPSTLSVKKTLVVGPAPVGLAISADGAKLYVALSGATAIAVIDLSTLTVLSQITIEAFPLDLVAGLANRLYVVDTSTGIDGPVLYQIDAITGATQDVIGSYIGYPAIFLDRKTLYVRSVGITPGGIYRYDVSSPTATFVEGASGFLGNNLILSHNQQVLCVPISNPDSVIQLVDPSDFGTLYGTVPIAGTFGVAFSPNDTGIFASGHIYDSQSFLPIADVGHGTGALITDNSGRYLFETVPGGVGFVGAVVVYDLLPDVVDSFFSTVGTFFSYQVPIFIADKSNSVTGLPDGLTFDAATLTISGTPTQDGVFPIVVTVSDGTNTAIVHFTLTIYPNSRAVNISTRLKVQTGDDVLIAGFIISSSSKTVVLRAIGPSLEVNGVPIAGRLANPTLELHDSTGSVIAFNDDWAADSQAQTLINLGIAPTSSEEAALYRTLGPGPYTMIVRGADGTAGIGLAEVYDFDSEDQTTMVNGSRLVNISTRGKIEIGDNVMIGGVIVEGSAEASMVVRGIGPSLAALGVSGALGDPLLNLYNNQGTVIASDDNWRDTQGSEIEKTGLAPTDDKESAIAISLSPGAYTAIVSGVGGSTGVGLVEAYNLP